jgi:hypothetical protein
MTDPDYVTLVTKSTVLWHTIAGYWVVNDNEICKTGKAG